MNHIAIKKKWSTIEVLEHRTLIKIKKKSLVYGDGRAVTVLKVTQHKSEQMRKLTRAGDNREVAQQAEDLRAMEGAVPDVQKLVEENLGTGKTLLENRDKN